MSIFHYKDGDHPGGFLGFRIVANIGDEYRQKYFTLRNTKKKDFKAIKAEAVKLEAQWSEEAKKIRKEKHLVGDHSNVSKFHATGYTGLRIVIFCEKKQRAGEIRRYYAPAFIGRGKSEKTFRISKYGYEGAWKKAVELVCSSNDLPTKRKPEMMKAIPDKSQFRKIRTHMNKNGHKIDIELLKKLGL